MTMATIAETHDIYTITFAGGLGPETIEGSYAEAIARVGELFADVVIGHDGDLSEGGDRTLFWASEEDAEEDPGARALGSIRRK
jgi:hypothetical protein